MKDLPQLFRELPDFFIVFCAHRAGTQFKRSILKRSDAHIPLGALLTVKTTTLEVAQRKADARLWRGDRKGRNVHATRINP